MELWNDEHRVIVVNEGQGTIFSGPMVQWLQSCRCLQELCYNGYIVAADIKMNDILVIHCSGLDRNYRMNSFTGTYMLSTTNTVIFTPCQVHWQTITRLGTFKFPSVAKLTLLL